MSDPMDLAPIPIPPEEPILEYFEFDHLPPNLKVISAKFFELAHEIIALTPRCPERTVALRKLLESKDCAVRAKLPRRRKAAPPISQSESQIDIFRPILAAPQERP